MPVPVHASGARGPGPPVSPAARAFRGAWPGLDTRADEIRDSLYDPLNPSTAYSFQYISILRLPRPVKRAFRLVSTNAWSRWFPETQDGYPDQVYAALRPSHPTLKLVKLGCPGETTSTMINGGICHYDGGSQLKAAVAFLQAHRGRVLLVTIDIGANDPEHCAGQQGESPPSLTQLASCATTGIPAAVTHLATIMARLKAAAGPGVRIIGMNYYLPALAEWRDGLPGHLVAWAAERLAATYNDLLDHVYTSSGARVANVFGAFDTADFAVQGTAPAPSRAMSPCCASGPGRAPLRPAGPTSTPIRPAIRSSPACSCKPPGCTEFPGPERKA